MRGRKIDESSSSLASAFAIARGAIVFLLNTSWNLISANDGELRAIHVSIHFNSETISSTASAAVQTTTLNWMYCVEWVADDSSFRLKCGFVCTSIQCQNASYLDLRMLLILVNFFFFFVFPFSPAVSLEYCKIFLHSEFCHPLFVYNRGVFPLLIFTFVHFLSPSLFRALNKFVQIVVNGECSVCSVRMQHTTVDVFVLASVSGWTENCYRRVWIYAIVTLWRVVVCAARTSEIWNNLRLLPKPQSSFQSTDKQKQCVKRAVERRFQQAYWATAWRNWCGVPGKRMNALTEWRFSFKIENDNTMVGRQKRSRGNKTRVWSRSWGVYSGEKSTRKIKIMIAFLFWARV